MYVAGESSGARLLSIPAPAHGGSASVCRKGDNARGLGCALGGRIRELHAATEGCPDGGRRSPANLAAHLDSSVSPDRPAGLFNPRQTTGNGISIFPPIRSRGSISAAVGRGWKLDKRGDVWRRIEMGFETGFSDPGLRCGEF